MIRELVHRAAAAVARVTDPGPTAEQLVGYEDPADRRRRLWKSVGWTERTAQQYSDLERHVNFQPGSIIQVEAVQPAEHFNCGSESGTIPPLGLLDLVPPGTAFNHLTGSSAEVRPTAEEEQLEGIRERTRTLGAVVDHLAELQAMTPAEVKRYPHLAQAFDHERKPIDQVGSATAEGRTGETLERAIAARTEPGGPAGERLPRTKAEINKVLAETRRDVSRQMTQTEQQRQQGTTKKDVRRTCPECQQKSGGPQSKACKWCHALFPSNPRKKSVL